MAYIVRAGEKEFKIEVKKKKTNANNDLYDIKIDDLQKEVNIARVSPTHLSILVDNQSYDVEVERFGEDYQVAIRGEIFTLKVTDERELITSAVHQDTGDVVITAPMPGLVVDVLVNVNDEIDIKDKLLILEAMKMQNEIRAPKKGKIVELNVTAGDSVNTGDRLIVLQ